MQEQTKRGSIYAATGEELASSIVDADGEVQRVYTYGKLFSHVVGYTYGEGAGLEGVLNYQLSRSSDTFDNKLHAELTNQKYRGNTTCACAKIHERGILCRGYWNILEIHERSCFGLRCNCFAI